MKFARSQNGIIEVSEAALAHFERHRQLDFSSPEAGGILLGRFIAGTANVVIDVAAGPSQQDKRTRFSFFRAKRPAQQRVTEAWHGSDGTSNYLGEWHTHPEDEPSPSSTDLADWKRIMTQARFEQTGLIFVLVGRRLIRMWELLKSEPSPHLLLETD